MSSSKEGRNMASSNRQTGKGNRGNGSSNKYIEKRREEACYIAIAEAHKA
jgi:hypothetical protein